MSSPIQIPRSEADIEAIKRRLASIEDIASPLHSGGGGGTFDGMEARVAKLESDVGHIRSELAKLANMPVDLAILKTRVDELPTKSYIDRRLIAMLAVIAALILFADRIQALVS